MPDAFYSPPFHIEALLDDVWENIDYSDNLSIAISLAKMYCRTHPCDAYTQAYISDGRIRIKTGNDFII